MTTNFTENSTDLSPQNISELVRKGLEEGTATEKYSITIAYVMVFVIGLIGNFLTCIVILVGSSMRTPLNCYLFNLAIADMILVIMNVLTVIFNIWTPDNNVFAVKTCFIGNYLAEVAVEVSMLTIVGLTIERYQVISHPFKPQSRSRAIKIIVGIWLAACICSYFPNSQLYVATYEFGSFCKLRAKHQVEITITLVCIFFIIPMLIVIVLYVKIGIILMKSNKIKRNIRRYQEDGSQASPNSIDPTVKKTLRISVAVVVAFFVCYTPLQIYQSMLTYLYLNPSASPWLKRMFFTINFYNKTVAYIINFLYVMSGAINPIIYSVISKKFRDALKETIMKVSCAKNDFTSSTLPMKTR